MRQEQLSDALTLLADDILQETDTARRNRNRRPMLWIKWGAVAACIAVVAFAGMWMRQKPGEKNELPMLTVTTEFGGGSFEGVFAHDITDLVDANPWQADAKLTTLPVYRNVQPYGNTQITDAYSEKMRTTLLDTAGRLGIDTAQLDVTRTTLGDGVKLEAEQVWIETDQQLRTQVNFEPAIALPKEYNFSDYASYADTLKVAEYLKTEYKDLIGMEDPQINISGGDYDIHNRQSYSIEFYEGGETLDAQIVNYNLRRRVQFCCDEDKLSLVWIDQPDLTERIADYPIITMEAARVLLANGQYIANVYYDFPGMEYVKKVELVYRNSSFERYFMPYYRFYVELPEEKLKHGLKNYGFYYVPAVQGAYIENMPPAKRNSDGETATAFERSDAVSAMANSSDVTISSEIATSSAALSSAQAAATTSQTDSAPTSFTELKLPYAATAKHLLIGDELYFLAATDKNAPANLNQLVRYDRKTKRSEVLYESAQNEPPLIHLVCDGEYLLFVDQSVWGTRRIHVRNLKSGKTETIAQEENIPGALDTAVILQEGKVYWVKRYSDTKKPSEVWQHDLKSGRQKKLADCTNTLLGDRLCAGDGKIIWTDLQEDKGLYVVYDTKTETIKSYPAPSRYVQFPKVLGDWLFLRGADNQNGSGIYVYALNLNTQEKLNDRPAGLAMETSQRYLVTHFAQKLYVYTVQGDKLKSVASEIPAQESWSVSKNDTLVTEKHTNGVSTVRIYSLTVM